MTAVIQRQEFLNLQDLRVLQALVYWLQQPIWPEKTKISREQAFTLIVNLAPGLGVEIDPANIDQLKQDPNFLARVALKISQLLLKKQTASIPQNLKELVAEYEKHLAETIPSSEVKESVLKILYPQPDEPTIKAHQQLENQIETNLKEAFPQLVLSPEVAKAVSEKVANLMVTALPQVARSDAFLPAEIEQTLKTIQPEINKILKQAGIAEFEITPKKLTEIAKQTLPAVQELAAAPHLISPPSSLKTKEAVLKTLYPRLNEVTRETHQQLVEQIKTEILALRPELTQLPVVADNLSNQLANTFVATSPQVARREAFKPKEFQRNLETIRPVIEQTLKQAGVEFKISKEGLAEISQKTLPVIQSLVVTPHTSFSPLLPIIKEAALGEPILPKTVVDQLAKTTDGVAFKPIYTILNPKLTFAYFKKVALTPAKLILDASASQTTPEWQEMIREGLFAKDIQASLTALKETGLPEIHPTVAILKEKMLMMVDQDTLAAKILRHYWEYDKLIGQKQVWEPDTKLFLPRLSPSPIWSKLTGFPWRLRQNFNELGQKLKIFQKFEIAPGKNIIRFVLPDKVTRFFTFGRFQTFTVLRGTIKLKIRQSITALAKTGLGKAVIKGAVWVATKLGVKAAVTAAAAGLAVAAGPPGWLIAAAVEVVSFIGKKILRPIFDKLKQIIKEPEKALGLIGAGAVVMVLLPMPFALIGAVPIAFGGLGLLSAGVSSAGAIASSFATGVTTFFTTLTTAPISAAAGLLVAGVIATLSAATFLVVMTTAGAFILPTAPKVVEAITIGKVIEPRSPSEAGHLAESIIFTLNQCGVTLVNPSTWETTVNCLQASNLPNKQAIIDQFHHSVFNVGPGLQCVGFVRGVMDALNRDPGGDRDAKDYLLRETPNGYTRYTDMNEVQVGDLVVMLGGNYGHIGIVVLREGDIIRVAQACGTCNGLILITELNPAYFDGFLRPN